MKESGKESDNIMKEEVRYNGFACSVQDINVWDDQSPQPKLKPAWFTLVVPRVWLHVLVAIAVVHIPWFV